MRIAILLILFSVFQHVEATAIDKSLDNAKRITDCMKDKDFNIVYLNGVLNKVNPQVNNSVEQINRIIEKKLSTVNSSVFDLNKTCVEYSYNQSRFIQDFAETGALKIKEALEAKGVEFHWGYVASYYLTPQVFFTNLKNFGFTQAQVLQLAASLIEAKVVTEQIFEEIDSVSYDLNLFVRENPTVLISHSEGNLFANELYKNLLEITTDTTQRKRLRTKLANLQVGTAALEMKIPYSDYYTAKQDRVIAKLLDAFPLIDILDPNIYLVDHTKADDKTIHGFIETYTNNDVLGTSNSSYYNSTLDTDGNVILSDGRVVLQSSSEYKDNFFTMEDLFFEKFYVLAEKVLNVPCDENSIPSHQVSDLKIKPYFEFNQYRNNRGVENTAAEIISAYDLENDKIILELTPFVSVYAYDFSEQSYIFVADSENIGDILNNPHIDEKPIAVFLDTKHEDFPHDKYPGLPKTSCIEYDTELRNLATIVPFLTPGPVNSVGTQNPPKIVDGSLVEGSKDEFVPYTYLNKIPRSISGYSEVLNAYITFLNGDTRKLVLNGNELSESDYFETEGYANGYYVFGESSKDMDIEITLESSIIRKVNLRYELVPAPDLSFNITQEFNNAVLNISTSDNVQVSLLPSPITEESFENSLGVGKHFYGCAYLSTLGPDGLSLKLQEKANGGGLYIFDEVHTVDVNCN